MDPTPHHIVRKEICAWYHTYNPSAQEARDSYGQSCLGYTLRPFLKKKKKITKDTLSTIGVVKPKVLPK